MKTNLLLIATLFFSTHIFAMEQAPAKDESNDVSTQLTLLAKKIDTLTLEIQALKQKPDGYVKTTLKYALVVIPALGVGYSLGLLKPIASLAYAGYEATQMVATLKELLIQLRETVQQAALLVPSKDQALPLLREVGKKYFGL